MCSPALTGALSLVQVDGKVTSGPDLSVTHHSGLKLPNPFVIGSGMPGRACANLWRSLTCHSEAEHCVMEQGLQAPTMQS